MTTPYHWMAGLSGHPDARSLAADLTRWHDRMVAHVRRHGVAPSADCCPDDDCPRGEAAQLWTMATHVWGTHAASLTFLRTQAGGEQW